MESYLYQYLVGGAVFALGVVVAWRARQVGTTSRIERSRLVVLIAGLAYFALLQGALVVWSALR